MKTTTAGSMVGNTFPQLQAQEVRLAVVELLRLLPKSTITTILLLPRIMPPHSRQFRYAHLLLRPCQINYYYHPMILLLYPQQQHLMPIKLRLQQRVDRHGERRRLPPLLLPIMSV